MDAPQSVGEDIRFIPEEPAPQWRVKSRWRVVGWVGAAGVAGLAALVMAVGIVNADRESRRGQCTDHLKRLGLAMHEYHEAHGHFPAPHWPATMRFRC